jgi:hypothetical protein
MTSSKDPEPDTRTGRALRLILGLQLVIALGIMAGDLFVRLPAALPHGRPSTSPTVPVSPGDQTRRFEPQRLLTKPPAGAPAIPGSGPMPRRLAWQATEIDGIPGVMVTGAIAPGDAARLTDYLDGLPEAPATIALNSPGGSVSDALAIGRQLRARGIETRVGSKAVCLSACPYVLAAGAERVVSREAAVGVHQHYFGQSTVLPAFLAVADIQRGQAEVLTYLHEMGIDPMLVAKAMQTDASDIYILVPQELKDFSLATELID